jgi:hypothetical protein
MYPFQTAKGSVCSACFPKDLLRLHLPRIYSVASYAAITGIPQSNSRV